ncbi:TetR/AcrR family transcriptional regulator [Magnetospirillum moscoviense]|uniref:TetR family transcriptional regulator n=1 Tax=Magnetospirillum moscoviense TaxID=1437059 RepID=A0A178M831_9PROT|nr:TetR family transcriptional regulator [Magnetospirillum moscoviense]MBF0323472.1 TetR family transcriptional regulator [Alphaproteobacteria bacterium]OAN44902.1 TetR family transcriptional regulator [Magnetospirillum moscoviense]
MTTPSTREKILDAAMSIMRDHGVAKLTLDQAARVAGVSKGGVLYHFKSKDDLIRGMVQRMTDSCDALHHRYYAEQPEGPYRWARTVVHTAFDPQGPAGDPVSGALLAAMAVNPDLMAPIQAKYAEWVERVMSDSPDPARAALVCSAMDGVVFQRILGLCQGCEKDAERLKQAALDLLKE